MKPIGSIPALAALSVLIGLFTVRPTLAAVETVIPISQELATSIADTLFPAGLELNTGNLRMTEPEIVFVDSERLALKVTFQAYDYRPEQGIAISEMGRGQISGALGFDRVTRQIVLYKTSMDSLSFDRQNKASQRFRADITSYWSSQTSNPIRADIPPHPYIVLFKDNIQNITYDGQNINVEVAYE